MTFAPQPIYLITYQGAQDVSNEIGRMVTSATYTDHTAGKSDELELSIANYDMRWLEGWWPSDGDRIECKIGYGDQPLIPCGSFKVDKVDMTGTPDVITIHALAAGIGQQVRTRQSRSFENTTLRAIADILARELELALDGDVEDIELKRVTMDQETTLAFLRRLAEEYGYAFSIRDKRLTFYEIAKLEKSPPVLTLKRSDLKPGWRMSSKVTGTYVACEVTFLDPATKKTTTLRVETEKARTKLILDTTTPDANGSKPPMIPTRTLRAGLSGDDVKGWQQFLSSHGSDPGPIDGIFGPKTRAATIAFQRSGGIAQDGVAGPETFRVAVGQGFDLRSSATTGVGSGTRNEIAGNVLRQTIRVESVAQAELKAKALLAAANRLKATGSLSIPGNTRALAGTTLDLRDMARISGRYSITSSKHRFSRAGYDTELEVNFVP